MKLEELFEKFNNASLSVDLGDKIFSLEIKLEEKDQKPKIETNVQEKNIEAEKVETPWRPLEIVDDEPEPTPVSEPISSVVEEKPKEEPKIFSGFKQEEPKKPSFESETGWFKTTRPYKGKFVAHYFIDGISVCDDGSVKKAHMLDDKCERVNTDEEDVNFCVRCRNIRKDAKQQHGDVALPEGYSGWARKNGGGNHRSHFITCDNGYMSTPCKCEAIDPKKWHQISEDDICNQCETCREASKAHIKLTPENVLETFQKNTVLLKNPVPLTDVKVQLASDDDIYFEAAKKCLERNRSSIIHEMRLQSSLQNKSIETMPVYFYTTEKVVKIDAHRDGLNKNANVSAVKMTISNREDGVLENPAFDINFLVQKQRKYMRRNK